MVGLCRYMTTVYLGITGLLDFVHCPVLHRTLKNTVFRKLDLFPSSGEGVGDTFLPTDNTMHGTNLEPWEQMI
jgi:hypothetical protein